jgi:hypothetical protein
MLKRSRSNFGPDRLGPTARCGVAARILDPLMILSWDLLFLTS